MPLRHGLDVSVVSSERVRFTEYGVNAHARSKLVTAKIEAKAGVQFYINIRPEYPFPTEQNKNHGPGILTRAQASSGLELPCQETSDAPGKHKAKSRISVIDTTSAIEDQNGDACDDEVCDDEVCDDEANDSLDLKLTQTTKSASSATSDSSNWQALSGSEANFNAKSPPFDLIAEVFIDGRTKPEIRSVVYLDPSNFYYSKRGMVLKGRRVRAPTMKGEPVKFCIHDWVFTDVGIEVLLERMDVEDSTDHDGNETKGDQEVAGLAELLQDTANVDTKEEEEQELKIGRIEIVFTRVVLGSLLKPKIPSKDLHEPIDTQPTPKKAVGKDVTHTTSITPLTSNSSSSPLSPTSAAPQPTLYENTRVKWNYYNQSEDFYARFSFDYTSRGKLVKWGLCDEAGIPVSKTRGVKSKSDDEVNASVNAGKEMGKVVMVKDKKSSQQSQNAAEWKDGDRQELGTPMAEITPATSQDPSKWPIVKPNRTSTKRTFATSNLGLDLDVQAYAEVKKRRSSSADPASRGDDRRARLMKRRSI